MTSTAPDTQLAWMRTLPPPSRDLPRAQRGVLVQLALAMGADGFGEVAVSQLAAAAGVSYATVGRAIACALSAGWLQRVSRGHRVTDDWAPASIYQLLDTSQETR